MESKMTRRYWVAYYVRGNRLPVVSDVSAEHALRKVASELQLGGWGIHVKGRRDIPGAQYVLTNRDNQVIAITHSFVTKDLEG